MGHVSASDEQVFGSIGPQRRARESESLAGFVETVGKKHKISL